MIIKRKTRKDIIATSEEDIVAVIRNTIPAFQRFNTNNTELLDFLKSAEFSSSAEFIKTIRSYFKVNIDDKLLRMGYSQKEILYQQSIRKDINAKSIETKLRESGLSKIEYNKVKSPRCVEYWLAKGYSEEDAEKEVYSIQSTVSKMCSNETKRLSSPRREEYWIQRGYDTPKEMVSLFQKTVSKRSVEYWLSRGYDLDDAKSMVSNHQRKISAVYYNNTTKEQRRENNRLCREFYVKRGFPQDEIDKIISNNGATFSLDICIQKYGKDEGFDIWKRRQIAWQNTLNSKTQEEKDKINSSKASISTLNRSSIWRALNIPGLFYIIPLSDNKVKIGITSKTMQARYGNAILGKEYFSFPVEDVHTAFQLEQVLIREFKETIRRDDYGPFGWTEVLNDININTIKNKATQLLEDTDSLELLFRKIQHDNVR